MNNIYTQKSHSSMLKINGKNNKIMIISDGTKRFLSPNEIIDGLSLEINGNNNFIQLELPINFVNGANIKIFNDNTKLVIESSPYLGISLKYLHGNGQICTIGKSTVMVDVSVTMVGNTELHIGTECMFSDGPVYIMPCDGHSILDVHTNNIVNTPLAPIIIGNHCWIGNSCKIIRGAKLPDNTIVGMGAIVNKAFEEEYTILAGVPAKIIKHGRKWDRKNPYLLMQQQLAHTN